MVSNLKGTSRRENVFYVTGKRLTSKCPDGQASLPSRANVERGMQSSLNQGEVAPRITTSKSNQCTNRCSFISNKQYSSGSREPCPALGGARWTISNNLLFPRVTLLLSTTSMRSTWRTRTIAKVHFKWELKTNMFKQAYICNWWPIIGNYSLLWDF